MLRFVLLTVLITIGAAGLPSAAARSYRIPATDIEVMLNAEGTLEIRELRTYAFHDRYHHASRILPKRSDIHYENISVWENGQPYRQDDTKNKGTFRITESETEIEVRWFFSARNKERTFEFHYTVSGLLKRYDDAVLLDCPLIEDNWRKPHHNVRIRVHPPHSVSPDDVRVWTHGPLWAVGTIGPDGSLLITCETLPRKSFLEVRALYPPNLFPHAMRTEGNIVDEVLAEEVAATKIANEQRAEARENLARKQRRYGIGRWLMPAAALLLLIGWLVLFQIYGQRPPIPEFARRYSGIPSKRTPAVVGYLLHNRSVSARDLIATVIDLAQRGFLSIEEKADAHRSFFGGRKQKLDYFWTRHRKVPRSRATELVKHEQMILEFFFDNLAGGQNTIALGEIKKKGGKVRKFYGQWSKEVKATGSAQQLYEDQSIRGMHLAVALGVTGVLWGGMSLLLLGPWALILLGAGIAVMALSLAIVHRTQEAEIEAYRWKAMKSNVQKGNFAPFGSSLPQQMDRYLVSAIVLGLNKKHLQRLAAQVPNHLLHARMPWFVILASSQTGSLPVSFAGAFSSMVDAAASVGSSATGSGGGTSGGGGGAGGGGAG